jgi:hypothetical protein
VFPNAKELTESFAANNAIRIHLAGEYTPGDERVTVIAVGDGNTPRTAALCAFLTKWQCVVGGRGRVHDKPCLLCIVQNLFFIPFVYIVR